MTTQKKKELKKSLPWMWIWVSWRSCIWKISLLLLIHRVVCFGATACHWGTVKIVWCIAALYNNTSVLFKIFPPETEGILLDNVRKVVLCVNLDSVFWKVFQVSRRTSFPLLIGSANTTFPFNFFSLYFNFFKCFTESHHRFLSQLKPFLVTYYSL